MSCIYGIDVYVKYHAKFLTSIGSNGLFLFILQAILTIPYVILWPNGGNDFRIMVSDWFNVSRTHVLVNVLGLIAFLLPIMILVATSWILNKLNIRIKV